MVLDGLQSYADAITEKSEGESWVPNLREAKVPRARPLRQLLFRPFSSRVISTSRVVYQPINHRNLWSIA